MTFPAWHLITLTVAGASGQTYAHGPLVGARPDLLYDRNPPVLDKEEVVPPEGQVSAVGWTGGEEGQLGGRAPCPETRSAPLP